MIGVAVSRVNKSGQKNKRKKRPPHKPERRGGIAVGQEVRGRTKQKRAAAMTLPAQFRVKELNAQQKCGHDTSVERLFRVDERTDGATKAYLVFLDRRHGWYCEHGVECPAVGQAKRIGRG
jgi:hypothetical protein